MLKDGWDPENLSFGEKVKCAWECRKHVFGTATRDDFKSKKFAHHYLDMDIK